MTKFIFQNGRNRPQLDGPILLVDDDEDDQLIFLGVAQSIRPGLKCVTAWNGVEALSILRESHPLPEIIFLDLNMPLMNGHQFLTEFRKDRALSQIPVVVLTTSAHLQSRDIAMQLGAWHFITKPSTISAWEEELGPILAAASPMLDVKKGIENG